MSALAPQGLTWTVLRVHHRALLVSGAFLVLAAVALIWLRSAGQEAVDRNGPCASPPTPDLPDCADVALLPSSDVAGYVSLASTVIALLPLAVALYAGAVLFGAELERGTARVAWTQSVTPGRWFATKLVLPAVVITAGFSLLSLLYRWARSAGAEVLGDQWHYADVFVAMGPVVLAYGLLALAVGALAGLLVRRALPAGGIALAVTGLVMVLCERWRSDLWPPAEQVWRNSRGELGNSAWQLENGLITPTGRRLQDCVYTVTSPGCREARSARQWYTVHHPSDHFWPLQLVETGILLALAALATAIAFRVLRRHHA
ncbi:hypothetical protein [Streptomyces lavendofoliae]|uniref:ABC transporter permease n=1 Tax=Streptomyces lavendofoliae TaxID=67314 RepID=A0A918HWH8_9ACTN|nr:hypothetical protein [Streptomyces lavendofoliae]GGU31117.1 hypothetical protein GCM10010274_17370 [Streptomyces lavendofoliae]